MPLSQSRTYRLPLPLVARLERYRARLARGLPDAARVSEAAVVVLLLERALRAVEGAAKRTAPSKRKRAQSKGRKPKRGR